jgi:hypothetical protein
MLHRLALGIEHRSRDHQKWCAGLDCEARGDDSIRQHRGDALFSAADGHSSVFKQRYQRPLHQVIAGPGATEPSRHERRQVRERAFFTVPDPDRPLDLVACIQSEVRSNLLRTRKIIEIEQLHRAASIGVQAMHETFDAPAHRRAVRIDADVPRPCSRTTKPSAASSSRARFAVMRETLKWADSSCSPGMNEPPGYCPS